VLETY